MTLTQIPSVEEVRIIIKAMKNNKAGGPYRIPGEIYKLGGGLIQQPLHQVLIKVWTNEIVPSLDFRDANIITIYKQKDDRSECRN